MKAKRSKKSMEQKRIDLHVHSTESDGTLSPEALVYAAKDAGLSSIALTDHDTVSGIAKASPIAYACGIELIPGIELSTQYRMSTKKGETKEIHILGLFIDTENPLLLKKTHEFRLCRDNRNVAMIDALQKEGLSITMESLIAENPDRVITRGNIAQYLFNHGQTKSIQEAFEKYIGDNCKCYVERFCITPMDAVALIKQAGGIAILAHPLLYHLNSNSLQKLINELKVVGLDGIEAIYSTYATGEEHLMKKLAADNRLIISGGSDYHGATKPNIRLGVGRGNLYIPYAILEDMKAQLFTQQAVQE